ncbi:MAG: hypothetical protein KF729_32215 [Sandaracinaceae bacterium]|nr:hypothetical protein [Sandaracinaceae bacterium]
MAWLSRSFLLALAAPLLLSACDCDGDPVGPACTIDDECPGDRRCVDGACVARADAGGAMDAGGAAEDAGARDAAPPLDAGACDPPCPGTARCRFAVCVPDLGTCASHDDCPGDSYCSAEGECLPYGVPPDVTHDPSCRRRDVLTEVLPVVQCEWAGPAADDPAPDASRIYTAPVVADLNLDDDPGRLQPSIVVTTWAAGASGERNGVLRVFDGRTCAEQLTFGGPGQLEERPAYGTQWAIGDLDGDVPTSGRPELVGLHRTAGTGNAMPLELYAIALDVVAGAPSARRLWTGRDCATGEPVRFANNSANYGPALFDLDDDGRPETLIGTMVFDADGCLLTSARDPDPIYISHGPMHTVADVDLDGRVELVTGTRIAEWDPITTEWIDEPSFVADPRHLPGHVAVVDLGAFSALPGRPHPNSLPEIVVVSAGTTTFNPSSTGTIRAQTITGEVIFGPMPLYHVGMWGGHGGAPTASDFDGDGQVEFAAAANEFYAVYDPDCDADPDVSRPERPGGRCTRSAAMASLPEGVLWAQPSSDFSSSGTGSSIFDFNGDGRAEAVYGDECFVRVYDGATGDVIFSVSASNGTGFELPVIADVDGDFATEVVVVRTPVGDDRCPASDPLFAGSAPFRQQSGFAILRDPEDRWASSRPIWNQHAYSVTHVTDDARVYRTSEWRPNWTQPGLNNFRQNVQGELGLLDIADLTVVFHGIDALCEATLPASLPLSARVCNRGTNPVRDGVLVHFIDDGALSCAVRTTRLLASGECEEVGCTGPVTSTERLRVVVDPDDEIPDCRPGNDEGVPAATLCLF